MRAGSVCLLLCSALLAAAGYDSNQVVISVAPFAASDVENAQIGKRSSAILNLQIWQTLRLPTNPDGRRTKGVVTWDFESHPPASFAEADAYAAAQTDQEPQLVLWGRAWRYGAGVVVEAFLSIRAVDDAHPVGSDLWTLRLDNGVTLAVGIPRRQIEFAPIVLRADLMPELTNPAGMPLYSAATGPQTLGPAGDYFRALEQGPESAKVVLPDGRQGWIRLPSLSREHSEVVDFSGAVVRILRKDWPGASALFERVVGNEHAPNAIKVDSYLYLAVAAVRSNKDPTPWIRKAYELNPYSRTVLQYMCMDQLARRQLQTLRRLLDAGKPLYSGEDAWFKKIGTYLGDAALTPLPPDSVR